MAYSRTTLENYCRYFGIILMLGFAVLGIYALLKNIDDYDGIGRILGAVLAIGLLTGLQSNIVLIPDDFNKFKNGETSKSKYLLKWWVSTILVLIYSFFTIVFIEPFFLKAIFFLFVPILIQLYLYLVKFQRIKKQH